MLTQLIEWIVLGFMAIGCLIVFGIWFDLSRRKEQAKREAQGDPGREGERG